MPPQAYPYGGAPYGAAPYGAAPYGAYGSGPVPVPGAAAPGVVPPAGTAVPIPPTRDKAPVEVPGDSVARKTSNRKSAETAALAATRRDLVHPDAEEQPRAAGLVVKVSANSRVFVDGKELKGRSTRRQFSLAEPLTPGAAQKCVVRVESVVNGQRVTQRETVLLKAGRMIELTFAIPAKAEDQKVAQAR